MSVLPAPRDRAEDRASERGAQPCIRAERQTAVLFGSRSASRSGRPLNASVVRQGQRSPSTRFERALSASLTLPPVIDKAVAIRHIDLG
jgi:hypothetical protein